MVELFTKRGSLPMIYQNEAGECGLACIAMISAYHLNPISLAQLRESNRVGTLGATLKELMDVARLRGFNCRPLRLELSDLTKLELPVVLHWDLDHFVVLKSVKKNTVTIHDPAKGIRRYNTQELSYHFTGIAIEFAPSAQFEKQTAQPSFSLRQLFKPGKGFSRTVLQVLLMSILLQCLTVISPLYLQLIIDQGITLHDKELVYFLAILFFVITVFKSLVNYFRGLVLLQFSNQVGFQLTRDTFAHLIRLPLRFFENREIGDIVSRFGSLEAIKQLLTQEMITVIVDGGFSLLTLVLLYIYNPMLCFIAVISISLFSLIRIASLRTEKNLRQEALISAATQNTGFLENIRSISTTKINNIETEREEDWLSRYSNYVNAGYHLGSFQLSIATAQGLVFGLDNVITLYLGAQLVFDQSLSIGQLMGFVFLKQHFISSMTAMIPKLADIRLMRLELERLSDITMEKRQCKPISNSLFKTQYKGKLEFQKVGFAYSNTSKPLFNSFNFELQAGECLGVSGSSGSGKTTFLKLLLGLETPLKGSILIDDHSIDGSLGQELHQRLGAVMHGETLLKGSLAYNIHLGLEAYDQEKLMAACRITGAEEIVKGLPMGLATQVGELGTSFSAGQIQRFLLTRALYQNPALLVLDESLSNLGDDAALNILRQIKESGISYILVSHNKKLLSMADRYLDLDQQRGLLLT